MMNKKILRKFADPPQPLPADHELLHTEKINYIVRTAVRMIEHHRILILYIYDRRLAQQGDLRPRWIMFQQGRSDYITLVRNDDGTTCWRKSCFERLNGGWYSVYKYAFCSDSDRQRICSYFHSKNSNGFQCLISVQTKIQESRLCERQRLQDKNIRSRMKSLRPLPRSLSEWTRRDAMPAYFFYDYSRRKNVTGVCSACGHPVTLTGAKHNAKTVCPHCGRELVMKSRGRCGHIFDRETCQMVQRVSANELVIRIIKVCFSYRGDTPTESIYESARIFIRLTQDGSVQTDDYYYFGSVPGRLTPWRSGVRPMFFCYQNRFENDINGVLYTRNLTASLAGTPWQYCPIMPFCEHCGSRRMELAPFLRAHIEHPRFEHLVKVGFYRLASELAYANRKVSLLDETQNRTHRILQISPEDVPILREQDAGAQALSVLQQYCGLSPKARQALIQWQERNQVDHDIKTILMLMTPHKMMRYLDSQYPFLRKKKVRSGALRYYSMQSIVSEYRDYLDMCVKENYDMRNDFVLFPKDLQKSHDQVAKSIKHKTDAKMRRDFIDVYRQIPKRPDYQLNGLKIVYPAAPEDIIAEGHALHHCVGSYVDRVARGECLILFLRRCEDLSKPFYTIEVRNGKIVQIKGVNNSAATPEVQMFMGSWAKQVLHSKRAA